VTNKISASCPAVNGCRFIPLEWLVPARILNQDGQVKRAFLFYFSSDKLDGRRPRSDGGSVPGRGRLIRVRERGRTETSLRLNPLMYSFGRSRFRRFHQSHELQPVHSDF